MFMRHMPRTVETMEKLGFHFLYGYTKVADNSMVNLAPILVGDIPEALAKPKHDDSGDININWILPTQDKTDPTKLEFLWKVMKERHEFLPGFTENPADHYYRAYYLAVYENWKYEACKNGEQLQNEFVNIWRRFAHRYNNICHFGFTFVTTLTHEAGFVLEVLDEKVSSHLNALHVDGDLENSISVIMGDHGNRIGAIQRRYHGRIEERMPLMAIRLPTDFAQKFPEEYRNFLDNKYKLTSNFDIHKTLHDIVHMRLGKDKTDSLNNDNGRGISLFDAISSTRTCYEANIPENFCMCMTDVSNVTSPLPNVTKKNASEQKKDQFDTLKGWLKKEKLEECVDISSLETQDDFKEMAINPYARYGLRTKSNVTQNEIALKHQEKNPNLQYNSFEFTVVGSYLTSEEPLSMLVRTEIYFERNISSVVFEPMIRESPAKCQFVSIFDVCKCLLNNNL
uniref:Uncharacterized protein n=1 Tax=Caenorhabditis japonica TaxID=281687 RepID=A0A8R1I1S3_CAEJA